ncbi:MAG: LacI family transcriptional regulator [Armatimonadetes bacterium]|nr:LacI family transcriptional regulator [Armatimonadota bacterium]CUU37973.1 transcriptional regulator, LacI family [Armatimonadetes bacterium DC]
MATRKPTLREVAQAAGCSLTTTSNILQGRHELYRAETVERVLAAARSLGYRPNMLARGLAKQRTFTIGLVFERAHAVLTQNDYAQHVLDGVIEFLLPLEYDVKLITLPAGRPDSIWRRLENGTVDGHLLLAPVIDSPLLEWRRHSRLPVVSVGSLLPPNLGIPCVDVDNEGGMRMLTEWVIQQGHRHIGFVKGHPLHWSALQRERAFRKTMADYGLPTREEWIFQGRYTIESGRQCARELLALRERPTAVICADDGSAAGFIQECLAHGLRIPEDLSVAGFDDEPLVHPLCPNLTTVRHDKHRVGYLAAQLLYEQIETGTLRDDSIALPATLVIRKTVAPPSAGQALVAPQIPSKEVQR